MGMKQFMQDIIATVVKQVVNNIINIIFAMIVKPRIMDVIDENVPYGRKIGFAY